MGEAFLALLGLGVHGKLWVQDLLVTFWVVACGSSRAKDRGDGVGVTEGCCGLMVLWLAL